MSDSVLECLTAVESARLASTARTMLRLTVEERQWLDAGFRSTAGTPQLDFALGLSGIMTAQAVGSKILGDSELKACALSIHCAILRDAELDALANSISGFGAAHGLTGVLWSVHQAGLICGVSGLDRDVIEECLLAALSAWQTGHQWDVVSGAAGGLNAAHSFGIPATAQGLRILEGACQASLGSGSALDIGMAHGLAGLVAVLARGGRCRPEVLRASVAFLESNARSDGSRGVFPSEAGSSRVARSKFGWCYGDLSVCYALAMAATVLEDYDLLNRVCIYLRSSLDDRGPANEGVRTLGICHGLAGGAHMLLRLWQLTRFPFLADEARRWMLGLCDACERVEPDGMSLIYGRSGVALSLLGALGQTNWDAPLGMGYPLSGLSG